MKAKSASWSDAKVDPLPLDAPAYRLFVGAPLATVWIAGYDESRWSIEDIDGRFMLDKTTMPTPDPEDGFGRFRRGDVVIWTGSGSDGTTEEDTVWPPSLVVQATSAGDGLVRLVTIRDSSLECYSIDEAVGLGIDWKSHLGGVRQPEIVDPSVLDLWHLNVWCRQCGHLGSPVRWGFAPPPQSRDGSGQLLSWPEGVAVDAGCDLPAAPHLYECQRCDAKWGTSHPTLHG